MANRTVSVRLQAEIGQYIAGMSKASTATLRLGEDAGSSSKKAKEGFDLAGKGALLLGGAAVAGLATAVSASAKFEQSMSAVSAATQGTASDLQGLRAAAMEAGADTAYSATEAADAITEMAKAGVSTADIVGGGLTGALSLAAAGQLDVADAAGIASVAMQQFNLEGEDLPHVADLLAAGAGKAMGSVDDLGQALNQSGLLASAAGMSIEETTGTLAAFANAGLIGSDAGTSLKTALQMLQAPTEKSSKLMEQLGLDFYDSNGGMISMSEIAGQLSTKLGGLTEEQRNAALAQIFGSDAVRAANVLYNEGASGIEGWTSKVNDSGFAAKTAAELQDNLKGDLEKLGGAWDTLMIQLGGGAQGPLREVVQMFTGILDIASGVLDFWSSLPGPVQVGVGALGGIAALKGPVSDAFETIALKAMYAVESMTGPKSLSSAASGLVSFFGGPWGLAIAGAAAGLTLLVTMLDASNDASDEAVTAQKDLAGALETSKGAIDANVRSAAAKAAQDADMLDVASEAGIELGLVTDAILGNKDAYDQINGSLEKYLQVRLDAAHGNTEDASFIMAMEQVQGFKANLDILAPTVAQSATDQKQLADATATTGKAAAGTTPPVDALTEAMDRNKESTDAAKKAVDQFKLTLDILSGAHVSMIEVESALQDALSKSKGAMEGLGGSVLDTSGNLDLQSESGRAAADVLLGVRDSGNELIATMIQQGATTEQVQEKDRQLRDSFIRSAQQMGISESAARALADQILGIPGERETTITADTNQAANAVSALQKQIDTLAQNRTASINFRATLPDLNGSVSGSGRPGAATGGYITGPGTGTSDSIPVNLSNGEFVIKASRVRQLGVGTLHDINEGRKNYATGGLVSLNTTSDTVDADSGLRVFADSLSSAVSKAAAAYATPGLGSGAVGGGWESIWSKVHATFPSARKTSTYRPGDPGYHGKGKAVDIAGARPGDAGQMLLMNRWLATNLGANLSQLIYTPGINLLNGKPHTYNAATRADHYDHVHAAVYHNGTDLVPQTGFAYLEKGEAVIPARANPHSREFSGGSGGTATAVAPNIMVDARVFVGDREITDIVRVESTAIVNGRLEDLHRSTVRR